MFDYLCLMIIWLFVYIVVSLRFDNSILVSYTYTNKPFNSNSNSKIVYSFKLYTKKAYIHTDTGDPIKVQVYRYHRATKEKKTFDDN